VGIERSSFAGVEYEWAPGAPAPKARAVDPARLHVLLGWPVDAGDRSLVLALGSRHRITSVELAAPAVAALEPIDVAVLRASVSPLDRIPLLQGPALGLPEIVVVVDDDPWSPERFALEGCGFRYVVARSELPRWLPPVLPRLGALARARRIAAAASENRPAPPPPARLCAEPRPSRMTLHAAETRFRETYLRLLLAEHGSRRRAAEAAGVPYRSFCEMLRKLGISPS
jgi:hypothetical protein